MAKILYGVNGEGAGHSTRAKEVISHLLDRGHAVHVVSFDRGLQTLRRHFEVSEIYGLRFAYVDNRVRYRRTLAKNLLSIPRARASFSGLMRLADEWQIDLVITDFEPLSCRLAHHRNLPLIAIDNQHALTNLGVSYPRHHARDAAAAKLVTRAMTPGADAYLVISFFDAPIRHKRTFVFPPLLRREVLDALPTAGEHVLVYVTSPSPQLSRLLRNVGCRFVCYGFGRAGEDGNLLFKSASLNGFLQDLTTCKAVIANAGFSLVSEALHLGKPCLAVPVQKQFEQVLNAWHLKKMNYGAYWQELSKERVESFLFNLDTFRATLSAYPRADNTALLTKLDQLIAEYVPAGGARAASIS